MVREIRGSKINTKSSFKNWCAQNTRWRKMNNKMVREIRGAKINTKSSFNNWGAQNTRGRKLREQIRYNTSHAGLC
jgi:hypothetical protein